MKKEAGHMATKKALVMNQRVLERLKASLKAAEMNPKECAVDRLHNGDG